MKNTRRLTHRGVAVVAAAAAALAFTACSPAGADSSADAAAESSFPEKTITIVVPYAAGGLTDIAARALAAGMEAELGQTVIVENKEGASAITGTTEVSMAKPDGYTLGFAVDNALAQSEIRDTAYTYDSFVPVRSMFTQPYVLVAGKDSGFTSIEDIAAAGSTPYGVSGIANPQHLDAAVLLDELGVEGSAVPFDGSAPLTQALIGGNVPFAIADVSSVKQYVENGDLVAIAVLSSDGEEIEEFPGVPNLEELGIDTSEMVLPVWGLFAPAGVPDATLETLKAAVDAAVDSEGFQSVITTNGMPLLTGEAAENWYEDARKSGAIVKSLIEKFNIQIG